MQASLNLPSTPISGYFHTGTPHDDFQLPQKATHEGFQIDITLQGGSNKQQSSWVAVNEAVKDLVHKCKLSPEDGWIKPRWIKTVPG